MTALRLEGVTFEYPDGTRALDAVDLVIEPGTALALVGANGSGKTTLARHLDGLLRPGRGRVLLDATDTAAMHVAQVARSVGLCFQLPDRQIFSATVRDEVEFGPRRLGLETEEAFARARAALERVGMADLEKRQIGELSGGQQRRVLIARALVQDADLMLLDEPFAGLDATSQHDLITLFKQLSVEGKTLFVATHDLSCVSEDFDHAVLVNRHVVAFGRPADVFTEENLNVAFQRHMMILQSGSRKFVGF